MVCALLSLALSRLSSVISSELAWQARYSNVPARESQPVNLNFHIDGIPTKKKTESLSVWWAWVGMAREKFWVNGQFFFSPRFQWNILWKMVKKVHIDRLTRAIIRLRSIRICVWGGREWSWCDFNCVYSLGWRDSSDDENLHVPTYP